MCSRLPSRWVSITHRNGFLPRVVTMSTVFHSVLEFGRSPRSEPSSRRRSGSMRARFRGRRFGTRSATGSAAPARTSARGRRHLPARSRSVRSRVVHVRVSDRFRPADHPANPLAYRFGFPPAEVDALQPRRLGTARRVCPILAFLKSGTRSLRV